MRQASALYRLLGEEARLRLLRVLSLEQLNVTELTGILGLAQSGVSRHLGLLKDAGLVAESRTGGFTYYRITVDAREGVNGFGHLWPLLEQEFAAAAATPAGRAGAARIFNGSAANWRSCRSGTPASTSRCSPRRCTTRSIRRKRWPKPCGSCVPAAACCSSTCGGTTSSGCGSASAIDGSDSKTRSSSGFSKHPD